MNSMTIKLSRLTELFDTFNEKANSGKMQKLPYNMWKTMRKCISWANTQEIQRDVKIEHDTWIGNEKLTFHFSPEFVATIPFQPGDKPTFFAMILNELYDQFLAKLDDKGIVGYYTKEYGTDTTIADVISDCAKKYSDYTVASVVDNNYSTDYYWSTKTTPLISSVKVAGDPITYDDMCISKADSATKAGLYVDGEEICDKIKRVAEEIYDAKTTIFNKENKTTMKNFINFDFGPVGENVHMSPYGMAIKNADGVYVSYNKTTGQIMDVDILNFTGMNKFMYKVPVAVSAVAVGDIIVHQKVPMFVTAINNGQVSVVDIFRGEHKTIMPTRSPFGFDFITKIVSLVNMSNMGGANADNPFGNMLPLFLMGDSGLKDSDAMLMYMMTMGGQNSANIFSNPMMLYFVMNDSGKSSDMLPLMLMMNGGFGNTCNCGETTNGVKVAVTPAGN